MKSQQCLNNNRSCRLFLRETARRRLSGIWAFRLVAVLLLGIGARYELCGATLLAQTVDQIEKHGPNSWLQTLPSEARDSILWFADYETGNLDQWSIPGSSDPGGGVLNTGEANVVAKATDVTAHSGRFSGEATIRNAIRATKGNKAVRFMRWATGGYDQGGVELPESAYYSTWMYLPEAYDPTKYAPWDPGDGGWWLVFQFKSFDENRESQSAWGLNIEHDSRDNNLYFYLYSPINQQQSWVPQRQTPIPIKQWFHVEAFVKADADEMGEIEIWLDGQSLIKAEKVRTSINSEDKNIVWGIGNYTDHIAGGRELGTATICFDDSVISTRPLAPFVRRQHDHVSQPKPNR